MKRLPMTLYIGLLVAAMATPSFAADLPRPSYKAPIYTAPAFSWTGFYLGINGGYAWGDADISNSLGSFTTGSTNGEMFGVTLGYNLQTGYWVWGLEGDADYAIIKGNSSNALSCGVGSCEVKNTWFATARGRIGYAGWDRWMPYITGGAAFAGLKVTPAGGASATDSRVGWTAGAGIEYALWNNWSAKLEYLYADLGTAHCDAATCGVATDIKPTINVVRLGVNYRF